ncbi:MAG: hypothetical protein EBR73_12335 [Rhodobacteraceae bacterium]|nr:hypothetical protein [Paracoccaceae bacterium]
MASKKGEGRRRAEGLIENMSCSVCWGSVGANGLLICAYATVWAFDKQQILGLSPQLRNSKATPFFSCQMSHDCAHRQINGP